MSVEKISDFVSAFAGMWISRKAEACRRLFTSRKTPWAIDGGWTPGCCRLFPSPTSPRVLNEVRTAASRGVQSSRKSACTNDKVRPLVCRQLFVSRKSTSIIYTYEYLSAKSVANNIYVDNMNRKIDSGNVSVEDLHDYIDYMELFMKSETYNQMVKLEERDYFKLLYIGERLPKRKFSDIEEIEDYERQPSSKRCKILPIHH